MHNSIERGEFSAQRQGGQKEENEAKLLDNLAETAADVGTRATAVASDVADNVKQHPYTTLFVAAGLAFTVGALWKVRAASRQSQLEQLMAYAQGLPSAKFWRNTWR